MSEKSYTDDVTVEDILSHRTGLPSHDLSYLGDWGAVKRRASEKYEREAVKGDGLRKKLCPDMSGRQTQEVPLSTYTGQYWNEGYHGMRVETKDDCLFIDASDRSMGFTLEFEHVCDQRKYIAHMSDYLEGGDQEHAAEFKFEGELVIEMGIKLEDGLDHMIWFKKMN
ncbi:hypothetical protein LTR37_003071 [Vermiconidia calcicola]|uniref:Uncharacterized protein n=1 Tax=Vermiconidia calcicola TaxID=1690605 RepID=A0ACC3NRS8_9PEZI|nr:hypothetical protein LTR37_003071 [Vermiconidia calcicola]